MESVYKLSKYSQKISEACRAKQLDKVMEYNNHELAYINKLSKYFNNQKGGATADDIIAVIVRIIEKRTNELQEDIRNLTAELSNKNEDITQLSKLIENRDKLLKKQAETYQLQLKQLNQQLEVLQKELAQANQEHNDATGELAKVTQELEQVKLTNQQKDAESQATITRLNELVRQLQQQLQQAP